MREFEYSFSAWLILVYQGLGFFVYASQLVYLPKLHEFIFGDANTTLIFGAEYIVSNLSAVICSIVADRFIGRFRVAFWSNQITILGFLLLNFVSESEGERNWTLLLRSGCGRDRTQLVTLKNELSKLFLFSWRNNETEVTINMLDYNEYPTVRTLFYVAPFYEHPGEMIFAFDSGTKALLGVTSHRVNELFSLESAYFGETIIEFHIGSGCQSERESCRKCMKITGCFNFIRRMKAPYCGKSRSTSYIYIYISTSIYIHASKYKYVESNSNGATQESPLFQSQQRLPLSSNETLSPDVIAASRNGADCKKNARNSAESNMPSGPQHQCAATQIVQQVWRKLEKDYVEFWVDRRRTEFMVKEISAADTTDEEKATAWRLYRNARELLYKNKPYILRHRASPSLQK
ncbi:hypothetical protein QR680_011651 [Steinernema hermaphroditum]|uniref:Uncharacterized protein n=1 Tax=Steinernema hermaphroditum TaxID=289476 RepID=A0AA39LYG1_9BILA|nr:hypothetical protein QR680_011651 [Steinernema hermaphroditum]